MSSYYITEAFDSNLASEIVYSDTTLATNSNIKELNTFITKAIFVNSSYYS